MLIREHAEASPTSCVACGGQNTPVLDTESDIPGYGRVHLCIGTKEKPGCLLQALRESYAADPALRSELETRLQEYARENNALQDLADFGRSVIERAREIVLPDDTPDEPELELEEKPKRRIGRRTKESE